MPRSEPYSLTEAAAGSRSAGVAASDLRQVAAIDIGTNSTHLLIATVDAALGTFSIDLAEKVTTRLGERDPESGDLTPEAVARALETLQRYRELASSHGVEQIVTAATSAVREAPNGREFLRTVHETVGLQVDLVSGPEEARLIYLGVLSGMPFGERPHVILDIGGGSTELILADGRDARALTSTRVGAVRLQRDFIHEDPLPGERRAFLEAFIQGSLEPAIDKVLRRLARGERPLMVATSGTAMAVGALLADDEPRSPLKMQGYVIRRDRLEKLVQRLSGLTPEERRQLTAINERRAEIIVPGALILLTSMRMLGIEELVLSERALREGLIVDWMLRRGVLVDRFSVQGSIRQRTVVHQARRFGVDLTRAERVASHALLLYDGTAGVLHEDPGPGRELLWAAAMLYACGQHINISAYHKHSWYLIRHGDLLGYSESEHLMVAAIARYHRRSLPKKRHEAWQSLAGRDERRCVGEMALLLRMAAALDRRPVPAVASLEVEAGRGHVQVTLVPADQHAGDLSLERWSLEGCAPQLHDAADVTLTVRQVAATSG
jgi:exopolyphosphatase/guanosine-5'-triphosphate,3'-diphosphate pyrophosphatase